MKRILRAGACLGAIATLGLAAVPAHAAAAPYTDSNSLGGFTITDSNGVTVSGGSTAVPIKYIFSKIVANGPANSPYNGDGSTGASTYYDSIGLFAPTASDPGLWPGAPLGLTQSTTDGAAPVTVSGTNLGTKSLSQIIAGIAGQPSVPNTYELRLLLNDDVDGPDTSYFTAFVIVDPTGKSFSVETSASNATATTLTTTPASPATATSAAGTAPVVLSGTTTAASSVVNLYDGKAVLGTASVVAGAYTSQPIALGVGAHTLQAVANGNGSTSQASGAIQPYQVDDVVPPAALPEAPYALLLPLIAGGFGAIVVARRKLQA